MNITINYKGVDLELDYDYQPAENAETGAEAQYPGCAEAIQGINEIKHKGTCFYEVFENDLQELEKAILDAMAN